MIRATSSEVRAIILDSIWLPGYSLFASNQLFFVRFFCSPSSATAQNICSSIAWASIARQRAHANRMKMSWRNGNQWKSQPSFICLIVFLFLHFIFFLLFIYDFRLPVELVWMENSLIGDAIVDSRPNVIKFSTAHDHTRNVIGIEKKRKTARGGQDTSVSRLHQNINALN